jgi:natural product biosynthesis luciferase-like monooxygenase protein
VEFGYYVLNTYVPELDGPAADLYGRYFEQIEAAEHVGFDHVWVTEHHFDYFGGMTPSPQMFLTAVSQRTRRLRLGTSVSILPLHHPLRIAEDFAVVDVLSGGRLEFGVGRGMPIAGYEGFGIPYAGAQERLKEAIHLIERLWREPRVAFQGRYYQCPEVTVLPRPVQQPHPPIWVTANVEPEHFRWIGAQGYDLMTLPWLYADQARAGVALYQEARAAAGHPGRGRVMAMYPAHVAETAEQARAQAEGAWNNWVALIFRHAAGDPTKQAAEAERRRLLQWETMVAERRGLFGTPEHCTAAVRAIAEEFGITHLGLTFHFGGLDHTAGLRAVELWGREVVPRVRAAEAPARA